MLCERRSREQRRIYGRAGYFKQMARDFTLVLVGLSGKSARILRATLERHPINRNYQLSSLRAAILVPGLTYSGSERPEHTGRKISDSLIYGGVRGNTSIYLIHTWGTIGSITKRI